MTVSIIDGISQELSRIFGAQYEIYTDHTETGLKEPYFLITTLLNQKFDLGHSRFKWTRSYMIQFFPQDGPDKRRQCTRIGDILINELEYISFQNGKVRCTEIQYETVDDVLKFSLNCSTIRTQIEEKEMMKEIVIRQEAN